MTTALGSRWLTRQRKSIFQHAELGGGPVLDMGPAPVGPRNAGAENQLGPAAALSAATHPGGAGR